MLQTSNWIACLLALALALTQAGQATPALTTIQDVLYKADGSPYNGFLTIQWKSFDAGGQATIATHYVRLRIINGLLYVRLVPTANASAGAHYEVTYNSEGRIQFSEQWAVPATANILRVRDVRTANPTVGAGTSVSPVQIADVVGLQSELDIRPMKGPGYAQARVAVINASGGIDGATWNLSDCVRVDGSYGACGSSGGSAGAATFVDSETPSGAVDGTNAAFQLSQTPNPATSLLLWRNGVLQKQGIDYDLTGNTATFVGGAVPVAGDVLLASYRTSGAGGAGAATAFVDGETPAGTADGVNLTFTLAQTPNPPASLFLYRNGILQTQGLDYALSGTAVNFAAASAPQAGDVLQASYRTIGLAGSAGQVLCNGSGTSTGGTALSSLGNCTIPGDALGHGDRIEISFDISHEGTATGFQFELVWGGTVLAGRSGGPGDALAAGRASAVLHSAGTQWSSQNWISTQGPAYNLGTAPDTAGTPVTVDFRGAVAAAGADTVTLRSLTVVRHPAP